MLYNLFFTLMLLFSSGYSMDMTSCRKIGEMNNNINGQPLYSTGLYMCLELPNQKIETTNPNLLDYPKQDNLNNSQLLSNSTNSNLKNSTNSSLDMKSLYNSSNIIKNSSNFTTNSPSSLTTTPSSTTLSVTTPSSTTPSSTAPSSTTQPVTTTPSPILTTTPSPILTTTPSSKNSLQTTPSPNENKPPDPTTQTPTTNPTNIPQNQQTNNTQKSEYYKNQPSSSQVTLENNPLLPIVITLGSVIVLVFCCACCRFLYNQKKIKKIFTNDKKNESTEESDIERGEKKNRNSWTFSHKNMAQQKLRAMEQFKKSSRGKNRIKKPDMKPRLKPVGRKQQDLLNKEKAIRKPPDPKIAAAALKGLSSENKKKVRDGLLERAKDIPGGKNNPNLQRMLSRFPETPTKDMDDTTKKWYKEEFQAELDHIDIMNNKPLTPPPPLPVPTFNQQSQPPVRKVYGNPNNKSSPKMTINEINPESPIRN